MSYAGLQRGLCGLPCRRSCRECVEKHLGAARVLLSEVENYPDHRLLVIGHLHEAEDESREWPMLHEAIRQARKAYQTEGTIPDWKRLYALIPGMVELHGLGALPPVVEQVATARSRMTPAESIGLTLGMGIATVGSFFRLAVPIGLGTSLAAQALFSAIAREAGWKEKE